jgi:hypothetical protein
VSTGEVVVLALLAEHEGRGVGKRLLGFVVERLARAGHARLFLGCSSNPRTRSHGFYRHLGWTSTGTFDGAGDEVLELFPSAATGHSPCSSDAAGRACGAPRWWAIALPNLRAAKEEDAMPFAYVIERVHRLVDRTRVTHLADNG